MQRACLQELVFLMNILAAGHIEELAKPTYSTCIGLILKGYDDYEHNRKQFEKGYKKVEVPEALKKAIEEEESKIEIEEVSPEKSEAT